MRCNKCWGDDFPCDECSGKVDEDRITLERFADELSGMHTMTVRVERGDIVIDDGGGEEYVLRAIPSGGGLNIEAYLHAYRRATSAPPPCVKTEARP